MTILGFRNGVYLLAEDRFIPSSSEASTYVPTKSFDVDFEDKTAIFRSPLFITQEDTDVEQQWLLAMIARSCLKLNSLKSDTRN